MKTLFQKVRDFHRKHGFDENLSLEHVSGQHYVNNHALRLAGNVLLAMSEEWQGGTHSKDTPTNPTTYDPRLMRCHLMLEELGEMMIAMSRGDEVGVLDGIADLRYVTEGTAVAFGLPSDEAADEVHRSNMTKWTAAERGSSTLNDPRLRNKGPNYSPPNLRGVLDAYRKKQREGAEQQASRASMFTKRDPCCPHCEEFHPTNVKCPSLKHD